MSFPSGCVLYIYNFFFQVTSLVQDSTVRNIFWAESPFRADPSAAPPAVAAAIFQMSQCQVCHVAVSFVHRDSSSFRGTTHNTPSYPSPPLKMAACTDPGGRRSTLRVSQIITKAICLYTRNKRWSVCLVHHEYYTSPLIIQHVSHH